MLCWSRWRTPLSSRIRDDDVDVNAYVVGKNSGAAAARPIDDFAEVAGRAAGRDLSSYRDLWEWSVARPGEFRAMLFDFFEVIDRTGAECPRTALGDANMPGAQ